MRRFSSQDTNHLLKHGKDPFELLKTVTNNIPVEHITGMGEFYGRDFKVDKNVLIPRVETEEIIDIALEILDERANKYGKVTFADVGTGSGVIGITMALELEKRLIPYDGYLSEISHPALDIAEFNAREFLTERELHCFINQKDESSLQILHSDLLKEFPKMKFDLILSNLPYIPSSRISSLNSSVKDFEPREALDGGSDGLELIRKLLEQSTKFLNVNGTVVLEVDDTHTKKETLEFSKWNIEVLNDQFERNRFWVCTLL
ncbi:MAG: HemK/PrmC family methyltransferase [Candidatus Dojkabacteria bacterium]